MSARRIAIVGAGPAGLATARAYREHGGKGAVTMIGEEKLIPYRRPPLTKEFLRGELDANELPIEAPGWFEEHDVDLLLGHEVTAINPNSGTVHAERYALRVETIVLAMGAEPVRPKLPGFEDLRILTMRERHDSERIATRARLGTRTVVIGSGFISCERAASLAINGSAVTLVSQEAAPQQERLGSDAGERIAGWLKELGVTLWMGVAVAAVDDGRVVRLGDGEAIEAENVVLGTGVRPRCDLAEHAGLPMAEGAILTDARMHAREHVFAVGDVAYAYNRTAGRHLRVEHWGDALGQGEVAGRVLAGEDANWEDIPGFWSSIGQHTIKYSAWGDGHDSSHLEEHADGAFTVWYSRQGKLVGALTHRRDADYERARELIAAGEGSPCVSRA